LHIKHTPSQPAGVWKDILSALIIRTTWLGWKSIADVMRQVVWCGE